MPSYRKRPVVIEAEQFTGARPWPEGVRGYRAWGKESGHTYYDTTVTADEEPDYFQVTTLEGDVYIKPGDWLITGVRGEKYPCRDDIFRETYEDA